MKKCIQFLYLIFTSLLLCSCASYFTRKSCESTNWFNYGEKVALDGRRLTGDQFVLDCQKADADIDESNLDRGFKSGLEKYCMPDIVFQTGKRGEFFSTEMCSGLNVRKLQEVHAQGVSEYCDRSNGYSAGTQGKSYNKICPVEKEKSFLPEFNRGRRKYLISVASENENRIQQIQSDLSKVKIEMSIKRNEVVRLESREKTDALNTQIATAKSELRGLESRVRSKEGEIEDLRNKNREIRLEVVQLEN
jgi:hypothetical protein